MNLFESEQERGIELEESTKLITRIKSELRGKEEYRTAIYHAMSRQPMFKELVTTFEKTDNNRILKNFVVDQFFLNSGGFGPMAVLLRDTGSYFVEWAANEDLGRETAKITRHDLLVIDGKKNIEEIFITNNEWFSVPFNYSMHELSGIHGTELANVRGIEAKPQIEKFLSTLFNSSPERIV